MNCLRVLGILFLLSTFPLGAYEKQALYLTWFEDPTTSMVIRVVAKENQPQPEIVLKTEEDKEQKCTPETYKLSSGGMNLHSFYLRDLTPQTFYTFRFSDEEETRCFKTLSTHSSESRFAMGGDLCDQEKPFQKVLSSVLKQDPDFIVLGGDIAYHTWNTMASFKRNREWYRWKRFFNLWEEVAKTSNRIYPIVCCPGNHDVDKGGKWKSLYLELFLKNPADFTYRTLDIGQDLSLVLLDSGHFHSIDGTQTEWLKQQLDERSDKKWNIPIYHVSAYPSYYGYERGLPLRIREHWIPVFEKNRIRCAFEHHNHAYKKTHPLKQNKVNIAEGIVYFGDGCWGVPPRPVQSYWYLEKASSRRHFYFIQVQGRTLKVVSLDEDGRPFDVVEFGAFLSENFEQIENTLP